MLRWTKYLIVGLLSVLLPSAAVAATMDFTFVKNVGSVPGPTLVVIGGIDGDEPGGFHAAATLITRYQITSGELWIVPDLNTSAIRNRLRGDMNLKFSHSDPKDPLYPQIQRIKEIILNEQVDLVFNLHDGSGFYHPTRINSQRNPRRWGQSIVIDQKELPGVRNGHLHDLAETIIKRVNPAITTPGNQLQIKNMRTADLSRKDAAVHSLSWFALRHGKAALSAEAGKSHPVHIRTYYHLLILEALMTELGISYSRDFDLKPAVVARVLREDARLDLAFGRIRLDLNQLKPQLDEFPLPHNPVPTVSATNPLVSLQPEEGGYRIHYGNNRLTLLKPRYVEFDPEHTPIAMTIDGVPRQVMPGSIVEVTSQAVLDPGSGHRFTFNGTPLNAPEGKAAALPKKDAAIDQTGRLLRLDIYRDQFYSGMILLDFRERN